MKLLLVSLKMMHSKTSASKCRTFRSGLNVVYFLWKLVLAAANVNFSIIRVLKSYISSYSCFVFVFCFFFVLFCFVLFCFFGKLKNYFLHVFWKYFLELCEQLCTGSMAHFKWLWNLGSQLTRTLDLSHKNSFGWYIFTYSVLYRILFPILWYVG